MLITTSNALDSYRDHFQNPARVQQEICSILDVIGLTAIHENLVTTRTFVPKTPALFASELRLLFRDRDSSILLQWVLFERLENTQKTTEPTSRDELFFSSRWMMKLWMPIEKEKAALLHQLPERYRFPGLLVTKTSQVTRGVYGSILDEGLTYTQEVIPDEGNTQSSWEAVSELSMIVLKLLRPYCASAFKYGVFTGLSPQEWDTAAWEAFWFRFPYQELRRLARFVAGQDMPFQLL